jgi:hypothetical protein
MSPEAFFARTPGQAEDHFGNMNVGAAGGFTICATGCTETSLVFTLTAENLFSWSSVASVLMPTTGFGAAYNHGFEGVEAGFVENGVTNTQYAGFAATPLPAALPLFAAGFGGLGLLGWRRKRKNAAAVTTA